MSLESICAKALGRLKAAPEASIAASVALRKMRPDSTPPLDAVALVIQLGGRVDGPAQETNTLFAALQVIALLVEQDDGRTPPGRALREGGVSELRLDRFLRARPDQRGDQLRALARQLRSSRKNLDVLGLVRLLWKDEDAPRLRIAQDYYRAAAQENDHV